MSRRIVAFAMAASILLTPIVSMAASHVHLFNVAKYVSTRQDGSYSHKYVSGYNPNTGQIVYDWCTVIREIEHYTWKCNECSAANVSFSKTVEDYSSCGQ